MDKLWPVNRPLVPSLSSLFFSPNREPVKLGKIRRDHWNESLKINKITKFKSNLLKTNKVITLQGNDILQTLFCMVGGTNLPPPSPAPTIQTFVNFHNIAELYLCSLKMYHFQIW